MTNKWSKYKNIFTDKQLIIYNHVWAHEVAAAFDLLDGQNQNFLFILSKS